MTTLRDDGYLETDDPVVAACFIGQQIEAACSCDGSDPPCHYDEQTDIYIDEPWSGELTGVSADNAWLIQDKFDEGTPVEYPIRIPAATVAEVCKPGTMAFHVLEKVIPLEEWCDTGNFYEWLRTHTEATDG